MNPEHLFVGTQAENIADKFAKGRGVTPRLKGSSHGRTRLAEADVTAIRTAEGISQRRLAKQYGISKSQIGNIRLGKNWAHVA